jgi:uncharacterized protein (DUF433 family)
MAKLRGSRPAELRHPPLNSDQLLAEMERMQAVPGIVFRDGTFERVPVMAGTGIEVWEVARQYLNSGRNERRVRRAFHWVPAQRVAAALKYYDLYPEEIDSRIAEDEEAERELRAKLAAQA